LNNTPPNVEYRNKLYYNKYLYRARLTTPGIYHTHYIKNADTLREVMTQKTNPFFRYAHYPVGKSSKVAVDYELLEKFITWRNANSVKISMRMESNTCSVFSNNLALLQELELLPIHVEYTKAVMSSPPGTIALLRPKHNFRVYLKSKQVTIETHRELAEFLDRHRATLYPCKAMLNWVCKENMKFAWNHRWLSPSFFIEYDAESTATLLSLSLGQYLGKTYIVEMRDH